MTEDSKTGFPDVPFGTQVVYHRSARVNRKEVAFLQEVNERGVAKLVVLAAGGGILVVDGVHPLGCDYLRENPRAANEDGAWSPSECQHAAGVDDELRSEVQGLRDEVESLKSEVHRASTASAAKKKAAKKKAAPKDDVEPKPSAGESADDSSADEGDKPGE